MSQTIENEINRMDITLRSDGPLGLVLTIKLFNKVVGKLVADRVFDCKSLSEAELIIGTFH